MTMISEYFARVGADVDEKSLKKVDDYLAKIEGKLKKFNPSVKLNTAMGASPLALANTAKSTNLVTKALDKNNKVAQEGLMLSSKALKAGQAVSKARAKDAAAATKEAANALKEAKQLQAAEDKKARTKKDARNAYQRQYRSEKKAREAASLASANEAKRQTRHAAIRASQATKMAKANIVASRVAAMVGRSGTGGAGADWYKKSPEVLRRFGVLTPEERVAARARQTDNNKRFKDNLKRIIPASSPNAGASWYQSNPEILKRFGVPSSEEKDAASARLKQERSAAKARQADSNRRFKDNLRNLNPVPELSQTARNRLQREYENNPDIVNAFGKRERARKISPREIEGRRRKSLISASTGMSGSGSARSLFAAESMARAERNRVTMEAQREERKRLSTLGRNRLPLTASQTAKNRVSYFSREAAISAGVSDKDKGAFIAREMASREGMLRTTKRQTAEYQRQFDLVKKTAALQERINRGMLGSSISSRARGSARYDNDEINRLRGVIANQGAESRALNKRLDEVTKQFKERSSATRSASRNQRNNYLAMGGGIGAMSRYGMASLPFIGGAMGFTTLNRSSQEHAIAPLTVQAAFEAQGKTSEEGTKSWEWYKKFQSNLGVSYMDSAQDYTGFMANSLGSGLGIDESQDIFKGFSEYMTAMGLNSYRRKLVTNALTQTLGKGVVSMEELRRQMAESMAGTMPAAAKAFDLLQGKDTKGIQRGILEMGDTGSRQEAANIYARMNSMSGKTDQEKMAAMMKAVASGKVESASFMKMMAAILSYQAQPKLDKMRTMSIAEEGRFGSKRSDLMVLANEAGLDPALASVWSGLTETFTKLQPAIPSLVKGFKALSETFSHISSGVIDGIGRQLTDLNRITGISEGNLAALSLSGALLLTRFGKIGFALLGIYIIAEEFTSLGEGKYKFKDWLTDYFGLDDNSFIQKLKEYSGVISNLWEKTPLGSRGFTIPTSPQDLVDNGKAVVSMYEDAVESVVGKLKGDPSAADVNYSPVVTLGSGNTTSQSEIPSTEDIHIQNLNRLSLRDRLKLGDPYPTNSSGKFISPKNVPKSSSVFKYEMGSPLINNNLEGLRVTNEHGGIPISDPSVMIEAMKEAGLSRPNNAVSVAKIEINVDNVGGQSPDIMGDILGNKIIDTIKGMFSNTANAYPIV